MKAGRKKGQRAGDHSLTVGVEVECYNGCGRTAIAHIIEGEKVPRKLCDVCKDGGAPVSTTDLSRIRWKKELYSGPCKHWRRGEPTFHMIEQQLLGRR